jgi:hypothetical protein
MRDAAADKHQAARHNVGADNAASDAGKQASPQCVLEEGIMQEVYHFL